MEMLSLLIPEVMEDHLHQVQLEQAISMLWEPQSYSMMNNNKNAWLAHLANNTYNEY